MMLHRGDHVSALIAYAHTPELVRRLQERVAELKFFFLRIREACTRSAGGGVVVMEVVVVVVVEVVIIVTWEYSVLTVDLQMVVVAGGGVAVRRSGSNCCPKKNQCSWVVIVPQVFIWCE